MGACSPSVCKRGQRDLKAILGLKATLGRKEPPDLKATLDLKEPQELPALQALMEPMETMPACKSISTGRVFLSRKLHSRITL